MLQTSGIVETLNDRLLAKINEIIGEDPTAAMMVMMFQGNLQSIPEDELRENLERYMGVLRDVLDG